MDKAKGHSDKKLTLVLIGVLGSGKSSTGNSILGRDEFKADLGTIPITTSVEIRSAKRRDKWEIFVIDTPGLQKASDFTTLKPEIQRNIGNQAADVVYVITININKYSNEERQLLEEVFKTNTDLQSNVIIIFTGCNELLSEKRYKEYPTLEHKFQAWLKKNSKLNKLIFDNNLKLVLFENKSEERNNSQVDELLLRASEVRKRTGIDNERRVKTAKNVSEFPKMKSTVEVDRDIMIESFGNHGALFYDNLIAKQKQTIKVDKATLEENFGNSGSQFYDNLFAKQKHATDEDAMTENFCS